MTDEIKLRITGSNEASGAIQEITGDLEGMNDVGKLVGMETAEALRDLGLASWEVAQALGAITGEYIAKAGDAELVSAKLNSQLVALGDSAPMTRAGLDEIANGMSKVTRFDDEAILQAEGRLLSFTTVGKDQFPLVMEAAADLAEQMGMGLPEAVQLLGRSLETGTVAPLKRAGVVFDETTNEMIKSLIEAGDVGKAQELMLKGIEDRIGGVAEAAGSTFVGQMTIMETQMDNFREGTGQEFINLFMDLPKPIQDTAFALKNMGGDVTGLIMPTMQLVGALAQLKAAGGLGGAAKIGGLFTAFVASPIILGLAGLLAQLAVFKIGWDQNWFAIQDTFKLTGDIIRGIFKIWKMLLTGDFEGALIEWGNIWGEIWKEIGRRIQMGVDLVKRILGIGSPSSIFIEIGKYIIEGLLEGLGGIYKIYEIFRSDMPLAFEDGSGKINSILGVMGIDAQNLIQKFWLVFSPNSNIGIISTFTGLPEKLMGIGKNMIIGLWQGISGNWEWLKTMVAGKIAELIASIKDALHMSPQYFTYHMGAEMAQDLAKGFGGMIPATAGGIGNMAMSMPSGGGGSRGGTTAVNLTYAPVLSMATRFELESALTPIISDILRKLGK